MMELHEMHVSNFLAQTENTSLFLIYNNLTRISWENCSADEFEKFKKFIPTIIEWTFNFLHSLKNDEIIYAKQLYENLKIFVANVHDDISKSGEFKELIHQWTNAVNFYSLYLPFHYFFHENKNVVLKNCLYDNGPSTMWKRINEFNLAIHTRLTPSDKDNKLTDVISTFEKQNNICKSEAETPTLLHDLNAIIYRQKLLLLTSKKSGIPENVNMTTIENTMELKNILFLKTNNSESLPVYNVLYLLLFKELNAQISARHLMLKRSRISLTLYFCVFNNILNEYFNNQDDQIKAFVLYTNAEVNEINGKYLTTVIPRKPFYHQLQENTKEYKLIDKKEISKMLQNSIDIDYLVNTLVKYAVSGKKLSLQVSIFALYHIALINEKVIEITAIGSKFHDDFINNLIRNDETHKFRRLFIKRIKYVKNVNNEEKAWMFVKTINLNLSSSFGEKYQNMSYKNFHIFGVDKMKRINLFLQKFELLTNQPHELSLESAIEGLSDRNLLLLNSIFISENFSKNFLPIIKNVFCQYFEKIEYEIFENNIFEIKLEISLAKTIKLKPSLKLEETLKRFMQSDEDLFLLIPSAVPLLTESTLIQYFNADYVFISLSLLTPFLSQVDNYDLLQQKILIIRDDKGTKNINPNDILLLQQHLAKKTKTVIITPLESNSELIIKEFVKHVLVYADNNEFINLPPELKTQFTKKNIKFQQQVIPVNKLNDGVEELITADITEEIMDDEKDKVEEFCNDFDDDMHYISRTLLQEKGYKKEYYSEIDLLKTCENLTIVVGSVGMGKSTLFKNLIKMCKEDFLLPILIDLKNYFYLFQNGEFFDNDIIEIIYYESDRLKPDYAKILIQSLLIMNNESEAILDTDSLDFEKKLFQNYFESDKLCIFVDGLDEIPNYFYQKVFQMLEKIRNKTENKIYISSRPDLKNALELYFNVKSFVLMPFDNEKLEEFIHDYWTKKTMPSEKRTDKISDIMKKISTLKNDTPTNLYLQPCSPLVTVMIADRTHENDNSFFHQLIGTYIYSKIITIAALSSKSGKKNNYYNLYQISAVQQFFGKSNLLLKNLSEEFKIDLDTAEKELIENLNDLKEMNESISAEYVIHPIFLEYIATKFLLFHLPFSEGLILINLIVTKISKTLDYIILEKIKENKHNVRINLKGETLLNYCVENNYENIVKCLISNDYEFYSVFPNEFANKTSLKTAASFLRSNLVHTLLQPFQLENEEEDMIKQNCFLTTDLEHCLDDCVLNRFYDNKEYDAFKELLFFRKKVIISIDLLKNAPLEVQTFVYSMGFMYDPQWTQMIIKSADINNILKCRFYDYSLSSKDFDANYHMLQLMSRENIQKLLEPKYTMLDLINKSDYYSDQERLKITQALIDIGGIEATWPYDNHYFENTCSYITRVLYAAIFHDHLETFKHFLLQEISENYFSILLTAGKLSHKIIIRYLLENHLEKILNKNEQFLFPFIDCFSNLEIGNYLSFYFPMLREMLKDQEKLKNIPTNNSCENSTIIKLSEQNDGQLLEKEEILSLGFQLSLIPKRNPVTNFLFHKYNVDKIVVEIHEAVKLNNLQLTQLLISEKVDINGRDVNGNTPLHFAVNNLQMLKLLLTNGAMYNSPNDKFKIPFENVKPVTSASDLLKEIDKAFSLQIFNYSEENIAAIFNARNFKKQTLLHVVLEKGTEENIKHVVEIYFKKCKEYLPIVMNAADSDNVKPLHIAVKKQKFEVFKKLLEYGALYDTTTKKQILENIKDEKNFKTFYDNAELASLSLNIFIYDSETRESFYLQYQDENGKTALHYAVQKNEIRYHLMNKLMKFNLNFNVLDNNGNAPIDLALKLKNNEAFFPLLNAGSKLRVDLTTNKNLLPDYDLRLLYIKCYNHILNKEQKGFEDVILRHSFKKFLLSDIVDINGNTLLHHAVNYNAYKIILFLLRNGCPYNVLNKYGNSAKFLAADPVIKNILHILQNLFHAVKSKKTKFLFEKASIAISDNKCLHWEGSQDYDIKSMFTNAREQHYNGNMWNTSTLLHIASTHGKLDIVKWLIENGADITAMDFVGKTALQIAIEHGHTDIVNFLK